MNDDIIWAELDDEVLLLDAASGDYYSLNETATEVWRGLHQGEPVDQLGTMLASKYGIDPAQAEADVADLLAELRSLGLVR